MLHRILSSAGSLLTPIDLESLARATGFVRRSSSKCSPSAFLFALLQVVIQGSSSLNQIAQKLGALEVASMSRQALAKRFSERSGLFLREILGLLIRGRGQHVFPTLEGGPFPRILVEDSTVIPMAMSNAEDFPNNGNRRGATAGCKVNVVTDILSGKVVSSTLCPARRPDQALASEILPLCRKGDLVLRDKGYFSLKALLGLEKRNAFWLSLLPASVSAFGREGIPLLTLLRKAKGNTLDLRVTIGTRIPHKCRLVARRLTTGEMARNRRHRRREARKRGATPSKEGLARDGWSLVVTNIPRNRMTAPVLSQLYAFRWSIEISFRALKQSCRLHQSLNHKAGKHQIEAMVLAAMIVHVLGVRVHAILQRKEVTLEEALYSIEKVAKAVANYIVTRTRNTLTDPFESDRRHLRHDRRRNRITLTQLMICFLG